MDLQGLASASARHEGLDQKGVQMARQDDMWAAVRPCLKRAISTAQEFLFHRGVLMEGMMGDDDRKTAIVLFNGCADPFDLGVADAAPLHAHGIGRVDSDQRSSVGLDKWFGLGCNVAPVGGTGPEHAGGDVVKRDVMIAWHRDPRSVQLMGVDKTWGSSSSLRPVLR